MADYLIAHVGHTQKHDEHICWWKPDRRGYTVCVDKAGRYSEQEARSICASGECMAVPFEPASALARTTPYYRRQDGTINKLYDGGPHRPVENKSKCWARLKQTAVVIGKYAKPTPMPPSKQRAIYLDSDRATQAGRCTAMTHTSTEQPEALPTPEAVMDQAQVFASAWALYGSGSILEPEDSAELAAEEKEKLAVMVLRLHARVQELEASQAQRVPLSESEVDDLWEGATGGHSFTEETRRTFVRAIEAAHGITQEEQG